MNVVFSGGSIAPVISSGSSYCVSWDGGFSVQERRETWTWRCHYCGSELDGKYLKCPQCAGEKRERKIDRVTSYANIIYVEETETFNIVEKKPDSKWRKFYNLMRGK